MAKFKTELYSFILSRHSIRAFKPQPLNLEDQDRVKKILTTIIPLIPENEFIVISKNHSKEEDLVETLGAYGRFIIPPHYLIPYILGSQFPLVDLGYRIEQIAVHLWEMGIGCCYIGCLSREEKVRKLFELPAFSRIGAFLVYGYPGSSSGLQKITNTIKTLKRNANRKPINELFFRDDFDHPGNPPDSLVKILEAARMAPSAVNAQPWRFILHGERLYLFVTRNNRKYFLPENENYCFFDAGICMSNISLAMASLGIQGKWDLLDQNDSSIPDHPMNLDPVARLMINE